MADNLMLIYKRDNKVFTSKLEGEVEEYIEAGDEQELFLDGENWSTWVETDPFQWNLLEEFFQPEF